MLKLISVRPADDGWMLDAGFLEGPLMFCSGGRAEDAALRIATALAENGAWAEIAVTTRDGQRVSRFVCPPDNDVRSWRPPAS